MLNPGFYRSCKGARSNYIISDYMKGKIFSDEAHTKIPIPEGMTKYNVEFIKQIAELNIKYGGLIRAGSVVQKIILMQDDSYGCEIQTIMNLMRAQSGTIKFNRALREALHKYKVKDSIIYKTIKRDLDSEGERAERNKVLLLDLLKDYNLHGINELTLKLNNRDLIDDIIQYCYDKNRDINKDIKLKLTEGADKEEIKQTEKAYFDSIDNDYLHYLFDIANEHDIDIKGNISKSYKEYKDLLRKNSDLRKETTRVKKIENKNTQAERKLLSDNVQIQNVLRYYSYAKESTCKRLVDERKKAGHTDFNYDSVYKLELGIQKCGSRFETKDENKIYVTYKAYYISLIKIGGSIVHYIKEGDILEAELLEDGTHIEVETKITNSIREMALYYSEERANEVVEMAKKQLDCKNVVFKVMSVYAEQALVQRHDIPIDRRIRMEVQKLHEDAEYREFLERHIIKKYFRHHLAYVPEIDYTINYKLAYSISKDGRVDIKILFYNVRQCTIEVQRIGEVLCGNNKLKKYCTENICDDSDCKGQLNAYKYITNSRCSELEYGYEGYNYTYNLKVKVNIDDFLSKAKKLQEALEDVRDGCDSTAKKLHAKIRKSLDIPNIHTYIILARCNDGIVKYVTTKNRKSFVTELYDRVEVFSYQSLKELNEELNINNILQSEGIYTLCIVEVTISNNHKLCITMAG